MELAPLSVIERCTTAFSSALAAAQRCLALRYALLPRPNANKGFRRRRTRVLERAKALKNSLALRGCALSLSLRLRLRCEDVAAPASLRRRRCGCHRRRHRSRRRTTAAAALVIAQLQTAAAPVHLWRRVADKELEASLQLRVLAAHCAQLNR